MSQPQLATTIVFESQLLVKHVYANINRELSRQLLCLTLDIILVFKLNIRFY